MARSNYLTQGKKLAGFSLVELVIVITITGIISMVASRFIAAPLHGYQDLTRRAGLVEAADLSIRRMARDVRRALPNSVRVDASGKSLEILHTADAARYRDDPGVNGGADHTAATDWLTIAAGGDSEFNALGRLQALSFSYGTALAAGHRLAIYNTTVAVYAEAEAGTDPGSITPSTTTITITDDTDEDHFTLSSAFEFTLSSPEQRFYVVESPVTYICDTSAETLTRYSGYSIVSSQPTDSGASPLSSASSASVAQHVTACSFSYTAGLPSRAALLSIELTLGDGGESIQLLTQVHVENSP
jgi:MSHA biogenesis protein MshO